MAIHCLHVNKSGTKRICCWCTLTQRRVFEDQPKHGPRHEGHRYEYHWEPSSMNNCPRNAQEPRTVVIEQS